MVNCKYKLIFIKQFVKLNKFYCLIKIYSKFNWLKIVLIKKKLNFYAN